MFHFDISQKRISKSFFFVPCVSFLLFVFFIFLFLQICFSYYFKDGPLDIHHMDSDCEGAHSPILEQDAEMFTASVPWFSKTTKSTPTSKLKKLRLKGKDYKKGGDGLRGKNVTEAYRVKEKDLKRTMK